MSKGLRIAGWALVVLLFVTFVSMMIFSVWTGDNRWAETGAISLIASLALLMGLFATSKNW